MEKEFIPYEQALGLKELGFDEPCLLKISYSGGTDISGQKYKNSIWLSNGYDAEIDDKKIKYKFPKHSKQTYGSLGIPTYSQAFRWFREKHNLQCSINFYSESLGIKKVPNHYEIQIDYLSNNKWCYFENINNKIYLTYEEAELECLKKLIEITNEKI